MGFSRHEYWSGLPFPSPGDLPDPGIEPEPPVAPVLQADSLLLSYKGNSKSLPFSSVQSLSRVRLFATWGTAAHQAPPSMGFSRQEYWSALPFPSPGDLPDPEIKPVSPVSPARQADSLPLVPSGKPLVHDKHTLNICGVYS